MALPHKYSIAEREAHWRDFWDAQEIYQFQEDSQKPIFAVDTPPPYVSADHLHPGHIMSYSQAEFVVRFKRMQGCNVHYPMGFDDNGLPTERHVEKKYKIKNKEAISRSGFVDLCLQETQKGAQTYKDLWRSLGISIDWNHTYSTIHPDTQRISQWSFLDLYQKGYIEHREEPIMWDIDFRSALAQTDLDTREEDSSLNDIQFQASDGTPLIISTTRPELIPACVALFFHPDDERYQHLKGSTAHVPLVGHEVPLLTDETVDAQYGTGLMMVCTWGDTEDIDKWRRYNLDTRSIFNEKGISTEQAGAYAGLHVNKLRKQILADLKEHDLLLKQEPLRHSVQVSERTNVPVEFIQTKQWFVRVVDFKNELLEQGKKLNWYPESKFQIYKDWVESLKWDWCISRQRYYGVPIPVWYHKDTGEKILPQMHELPIDPTEYTPEGYDAEDLIPETDVLDTWMTSSVSPLISASLLEPDLPLDKLHTAQAYPASLRPQAFEIIRTWLFYTVAKSFFHFGDLPFSNVMISGHGLDSKGEKISKRKNNYTEPNKVMEQFGADALRFWATSATLGESNRYSEEEIKKGKKTTTKLFNAAKFLEMHLQENPYSMSVTREAADTWVLDQLNQTIQEVTKQFEVYEYFKARMALDHLFWDVLTDNYLEFIKYRLYDETEQGSSSRQAAFVTLYEVFFTITKLYAPILPYITEEVYQGVFRDYEHEVSIHVSSWPQEQDDWQLSSHQRQEFNQVIELVEAIRGYKSRNGISLGQELEEFSYSGASHLEPYREFVEKATKVKRIILEK